MTIDIIRLEDAHTGTFGTLLIDGRVFCTTLERPWAENIRNFSCIPEGVYECVRRKEWKGAKKHGDTFEVKDVPERSAILFHPANFVDELEGCIAVGRKPGPLRGKRAILNSGNTFKRLMARIGSRHKISLRITSMIVDRRRTFFRLKNGYDEDLGRQTECR